MLIREGEIRTSDMMINGLVLLQFNVNQQTLRIKLRIHLQPYIPKSSCGVSLRIHRDSGRNLTSIWHAGFFFPKGREQRIRGRGTF